MPDDILDAAQKKIDEAASPAIPPEPDPLPMDNPDPVKTVLEPTAVTVAPEESPAQIEAPVATRPPKKTKLGPILAVLLLLFVTIPTAVYFVAQQRELADSRSQAVSCLPLSDCGGNLGKLCTGCPGYSYSYGKCCKTVVPPPNTPKPPPPSDCRLTGCTGGQTCESVGANWKCVAGAPTPTKPPPAGGSCTQCTDQYKCVPVANIQGCDSNKNVCESNFDCGGTGPSPSPKDTNVSCTACIDQYQCKTIKSPPNCRPELNACDNNFDCGGTGPSPTPKITPQTNNCSQVKCTSTSCTVGNMYDGTGASNCVVWRYKCPNNWPAGKGCQENGTAGRSGSFSGCGTEQIDIYCPVCGIGSGQMFISKFNQGSCGGGGNTPNPTPTTPVTSFQCQSIKIYKNGAVFTDYSSLRAGDQITIAVVGATATKARIRVNGAAWTETSTKNASGEFTLNYTIASGVTSFTFEAEVYRNGVWK